MSADKHRSDASSAGHFQEIENCWVFWRHPRYAARYKLD
jgi:hypothetical protein